MTTDDELAPDKYRKRNPKAKHAQRPTLLSLLLHGQHRRDLEDVAKPARLDFPLPQHPGRRGTEPTRPSRGRGRPHPMTLFAITCDLREDADVYGVAP